MKPKVDITIVVAGIPFNGDTIKTQSLGGSETAGYYMGLELAKRGHRVTMFTNGEEGMFDGVDYNLKFLGYLDAMVLDIPTLDSGVSGNIIDLKTTKKYKKDK